MFIDIVLVNIPLLIMLILNIVPAEDPGLISTDYSIRCYHNHYIK